MTTSAQLTVEIAQGRELHNHPLCEWLGYRCDMDLPAIGAQIRMARETLGMTQADVAAAAAVTPQMISLVELGKRNMTVETLRTICHVVGLDVRVDLESDAVTVGHLSPEDRELAARVVRGLPRLSQTFRDMLGLMLTQLEAEEAKRKTG